MTAKEKKQMNGEFARGMVGHMGKEMAGDYARSMNKKMKKRGSMKKAAMKGACILVLVLGLSTYAHAGLCQIYTQGSADGSVQSQLVDTSNRTYQGSCEKHAKDFSLLKPYQVFNVYWYFNFIGQAFNGQFGHFN